MRFRNLLLLLLVLALCLACALPVLAQDGGAIYKAKCAACHGPEGQGKVGPALKGTSVSAEDIVALLTKGNEAKKAPHKKPLSGVSEADAKAVADYVKAIK